MASPSRLPSWRAVVALAACYGLALVVLTWPVYRHPTTTVVDTASLYGDAGNLIQRDINLTIWALSWDVHALTTDPLHVYDANAFYPAPYSLACSEHMLGNLPIYGPPYVLTGNPVLAHQVALVLTFVLSGLAMAAWALYWTGDPSVAAAAGFFFAFAPYRFWQLGNLHVISIQYLPLVLLGIDATLDRRGGRWAPIGLGAALALSSLCSYYIGYAAFALAGTYLLVRTIERRADGLGRPLAALAGIAVAGAIVAALTVPYLILQRSGILTNYGEKGYIGLAFLSMLKHGALGLLSFYLLPRKSGVPEFLSFTGMALAAVGLLARRTPARAALVAVAVTGAVLALGPFMLLPGIPGPIPMPYALLVRIVPGFSAMRVPHRFGALVTLAMAALATGGLAALRAALQRRGRDRLAALLPIVAVVALLVESTPRGLRPYPMLVGAAVPEPYRYLAAHPDGGPLLELPAHPYALFRESLFMYYSTFHWHPLANGYSAYPPKTYTDIMTTAMQLPDPSALDAVLAKAPFRWLLFHRDDGLKPADRPAWEALLRARFRPVVDDGHSVLFEIPAAPAG